MAYDSYPRHHLGRLQHVSECQGQSLDFISILSFVLMYTLRDSGDSLSGWVPAAHKGDPESRFPGFGLVQPWLSHCHGHLESE